MSVLNNEITTPQQRANGTRAFYCTRTEAIYTSHKNGYVRRKTKKGSQYPLNRREEYSTISFASPTPFTYSSYIMIHPEFRRLGLINTRAVSYKPRS